MNFKNRVAVESQEAQIATLGAFASRVYGWLTCGLGLTALIAFLSFQNGWFIALAPYNIAIVLAGFAVSMVISLGINRLSFVSAAALFVLYSLLQGLLFGTILPLYAMRYGGDIIWVSFATAGALFATATVYGRTTRSDLTQIGQLLNFGVIALLIISVLCAVLSFFMPIGIFDLLIAYLGLVIFVGLLVTDSQQIRLLSQQVESESESASKLSLIMALRMYINVIMVFMYLLRIFASGKDSR